jgi:N-acetylmuramoyl-L-alanine amidase
MSHRAGWALVLGALLLGVPASAAEQATGAADPPPRATGDYPVASDIRFGGDDTATRFVVDLSEKIDIRAFTLANPYRVVIDMPQVTFKLAARAGETGRGLIKAYRFGLVMQGGSRIVIDLARPARIDKSFMLETSNEQPAKLVLDLAATDRESFLRTIALENRAAADVAERKRERPNDHRQSSDPRPLVVIDPGHGGIDSGTRAPSGEHEKTIVLEFCVVLRDKLEKTGKYRVAMTRTDDSFVSLGDRVSLARSRRAALFVSVHADALRPRYGSAQGVTVYTLSERASDAAAARFAEAENRADLIAGLDLSREPDDVADILIDLARRETKAYSVQFARRLVGDLRSAAKMHPQPLKSAGLRVLRAPDVPSVLVELGFVTNKEDVKLLTSEAWRGRAADAMVQAIDIFFTTRLAGSGRN